MVRTLIVLGAGTMAAMGPGALAQVHRPSTDADRVDLLPFGMDVAEGIATAGEVAFVGDVDGDGVSDYVLSTAVHFDEAGPAAGRAAIVSGATGEVIRLIVGASPSDRLGHSADGVRGDLNQDGVPDIVLGALSGPRRMDVYSSKTGALIWSFVGESQLPGMKVRGVGNVNNDLFVDVSGGPFGSAGSFAVFSGRDGQPFAGLCCVVAEWVGRVDADPFADLLEARPASRNIRSTFTGEVIHQNIAFGVGDRDGDGWNDLMSIEAPSGTIPGGRLAIVSGATGAVLHRVNNVADALALDRTTRPFRTIDTDGDGFPDIGQVVEADPESKDTGFVVRVVSGRTGRLLLELTHTTDVEPFGLSAAGDADVNGDGLSDLLVRSVRTTGVLGEDGVAAYVFLSPPVCPADADADRLVGFSDLNLVVSQFNAHNEPDEIPTGFDGDVDHDGDVDFADLNIVLGAFNTACEGSQRKAARR